jgi:hypothetical protein
MAVYLGCVYCAAGSQWEEGAVTLGCGPHNLFNAAIKEFLRKEW